MESQASSSSSSVLSFFFILSLVEEDGYRSEGPTLVDTLEGSQGRESAVLGDGRGKEERRARDVEGRRRVDSLGEGGFRGREGRRGHGFMVLEI